MPLTRLPEATRIAPSALAVPAGENWTDADAIGARELLARGTLEERDVVGSDHDPTLDFMPKQASFKLLRESSL